jgi:hypothetical protein
MEILNNKSLSVKLKSSKLNREIFFSLMGDANHNLNITNETLTCLFLLPLMSDKSFEAIALKSGNKGFISNISKIQDIYKSWEPNFNQVEIEFVNSSSSEQTVKTGRIGCFFTGGVDSFYTFLKNKDEITDLIFVHGYDLGLENTLLRGRVSQKIKDVAEKFGKNLIQIETNYRGFIDLYVPWGAFGHGVALMTIGHLLTDALDKIYVPSSYTYAELFPWGSHPILDPLWSSGNLQFVHHGCEATRINKVDYISNEDIALKSLRVCWENPNSEYNCGRCEKCLRTMINLRACNKLDECTTFSSDFDYKLVSQIFVHDEHGRAFVQQNYDELVERNIDPKLQRILLKVLNKSLWLYNLKQKIPTKYKDKLKENVKFLKDLSLR